MHWRLAISWSPAVFRENWWHSSSWQSLLGTPTPPYAHWGFILRPRRDGILRTNRNNNIVLSNISVSPPTLWGSKISLERDTNHRGGNLLSLALVKWPLLLFRLFGTTSGGQWFIFSFTVALQCITGTSRGVPAPTRFFRKQWSFVISPLRDGCGSLVRLSEPTGWSPQSNTGGLWRTMYWGPFSGNGVSLL